jgi:hypothetical protein
MMIKAFRPVLSLATGLLLATAFAACSSSSSNAVAQDGGGGGDHMNFCDLPKPCQEIAEACHSKDDGTPGEIHECHETGHDVGTLEACQKVHDSCMATCAAAPTLPGPHENLGANCHDGGGSADAATKG